MAPVRDDDHITVSIYPFTDDEVEFLMDSAQHMAGTFDESELGERSSSDTVLLRRETEMRGLPER